MWVDSCTVDLGGVRAGIRANSQAAASGLRQLLGRHVVDDPDAPRNFSVQFSRDPHRAHLLYWGGCVAARSFDPDRLVRAVLRHLSAHLHPPEGLVLVRALPFVHDGVAVLMPETFRDDLRIEDRRLRGMGYVSVDSPRALVDLARAELVVDEPLDTDDRALPLVVSGAARRRIEPTVEPGRYPIERWVFLSQLAQWGDLSRATATRVGVLDVVDGITRLDEGVIRTMAALFTKVRATSMFPTYPGAVVDALVGRGRAT